MTLKTLIISLVVYLILSLPVCSYAVGVGECSQRNDCNDCPSKSRDDCSCICRALGHDPNCSSGEFNGYPNGVKCVGDLSCPNLARCVLEECGCTAGNGGGPGQSMMILGRVFVDNNRNGSYDKGDIFVQSNAHQCGGFENLGIRLKVKNLSNPDEVTVNIDKCNPEPYYNFYNFSPGSYSVEVLLPEGWEQTTPSPVSITLDKEDKHIWFGIAKTSDISCSDFEVNPKICLEKEGVAKSVFSGKPLVYNFESGCLKFSNNEHVLRSTANEVKIFPTGLGSCEISASATIDGINFVSCPKKFTVIDECKVSCGSITANPAVVKTGQSSLIKIEPRGEAPFSYSWSSPISVCRLEATGGSVLLTPSEIPKINGFDSSCPVSVHVIDKNLGMGVDCSVNVGVTMDSTLNPTDISWFKTVGGDVFSANSISSAVPMGEYFSSYLVYSIKTMLFDFSGARTGMERASQKGWAIANASGEIPYSIYSFDYFISNFPPDNQMQADEIKNSDFLESKDMLISPLSGFGGVLINEQISVLPGKIIRVYINGDLNIKNNIEISGDSVVLFIVSGNLNITDNVTKVSGAFFVDGTVNLTDRINSPNPLEFFGMMGVSKNGKLFGLYRNSGTGEFSEVFNFEPKYLLKLISLFNKPKRVWLEVAP